MIRLVCLAFQIFILYISFSVLIPWAWNFNDNTKWTLEDEKNKESYSSFNHFFRAVATGLTKFYVGFFGLIFIIYITVAIVMIIKGKSESVCKVVRMVCGLLKDYYVSTVLNDSYFIRVQQRVGINVSDDKFENMEARDDFVHDHEIDYAQRSKDHFNECAICISQFDDHDTVVELHCQHIFHNKCFDAFLENTEQVKACPICREEVK